MKASTAALKVFRCIDMESKRLYGILSIWIHQLCQFAYSVILSKHDDCLFIVAVFLCFSTI